MRALIAGALLLPACGSRSGLLGGGESELLGNQPGAAPLAGFDFRRFRSACVDDWQPLETSAAVAAAPLAVVNGELVYGVFDLYMPRTGIDALDLTRRTSRTVVPSATAEDLWVEGDDIWYWDGGELFRVPSVGGTPERVLEVAAPPYPEFPTSVLATPEAFYWTRGVDGSSTMTLWEQRRPSGDADILASFSVGDFGDVQLGAGAESVVVAGFRAAMAVATASGDETALDVRDDSTLAGVDETGGYYWRAANRTARGGRALEFELRRAPADGSEATRLWGGRAGKFLSRLWRVETGWLAIGSYYLADRRPHSVIVHLDAAGNERVLACDTSGYSIMERPVAWESSLYVLVGRNGIIRIVEIDLSE